MGCVIYSPSIRTQAHFPCRDQLSHMVSFQIFYASGIVLILLFFYASAFLMTNFFAIENQVFQFFVRATDHGSPRLHSEAPVDVYIMSPNDVPPLFERTDDKFFITESATPGQRFSIMLIVVSAFFFFFKSNVKFVLLSHRHCGDQSETCV